VQSNPNCKDLEVDSARAARFPARLSVDSIQHDEGQHKGLPNIKLVKNAHLKITKMVTPYVVDAMKYKLTK
jgi:hypothetical protein